MISNFGSPFPATRMRRLRQSAALRQFVAETELNPRQLVLPLFVRSGQKVAARFTPCQTYSSFQWTKR